MPRWLTEDRERQPYTLTVTRALDDNYYTILQDAEGIVYHWQSYGKTAKALRFGDRVKLSATATAHLKTRGPNKGKINYVSLWDVSKMKLTDREDLTFQIERLQWEYGRVLGHNRADRLRARIDRLTARLKALA